MQIKIGKKTIGDDQQIFIVAELSGNHKQDFNLAVKTIKAMKESGADAVKLQTYTADTMTINHQSKYFKIRGDNLWKGRNLYELYQEAYTPWEWQPKLQKIAHKLGLIIFSTPFDKTAVDFLEKMKVPAYKVASHEIVDIPLLEYIASKEKPIIISTGIASPREIKEAIQACYKKGNRQVILLKCVSSYPTQFSQLNLRTIPDMKKRFKTVVGLSDHSLSISVPVAAVALGAKVIEKHFVLDRKLNSVDSAFSLEPKEFALMVKETREIEESLGKISYRITKKNKTERKFARSLFAVIDMAKGAKFTANNIRSIRPNDGIAPKYYYKILGKRAKKDIKKGTPLRWNLIN